MIHDDNFCTHNLFMRLSHKKTRFPNIFFRSDLFCADINFLSGVLIYSTPNMNEQRLKQLKANAEAVRTGGKVSLSYLIVNNSFFREPLAERRRLSTKLPPQTTRSCRAAWRSSPSQTFLVLRRSTWSRTTELLFILTIQKSRHLFRPTRSASLEAQKPNVSIFDRFVFMTIFRAHWDVARHFESIGCWIVDPLEEVGQ